jgi:hypothetical protein
MFMESETRRHYLIAYFFGGAILANTIPHLVLEGFMEATSDSL